MPIYYHLHTFYSIRDVLNSFRGVLLESINFHEPRDGDLELGPAAER